MASLLVNAVLVIITAYYAYFTRNMLNEMIRSRERQIEEQRTAVAAAVGGWVELATPESPTRARLMVAIKNGSPQAVYITRVDVFEDGAGLLQEDALPTKALGPHREYTFELDIRTNEDTGRQFRIALDFREGTRMWKRTEFGELIELSRST